MVALHTGACSHTVVMVSGRSKWSKWVFRCVKATEVVSVEGRL